MEPRTGTSGLDRSALAANCLADLTGRPPFQAVPKHSAQARDVVADDVLAVDLDPAIEDVVARRRIVGEPAAHWRPWSDGGSKASQQPRPGEFCPRTGCCFTIPGVTSYHLAQYNIAWIVAPLDSPVMADFTNNIAEINQLAEQAPGFSWRHQTADGDSTAIRVRDDDRIVINFSVWEDAESLFQYAFYSGHADYFRRRKEWFTHEEEPYAVLWWVPAGHEPSVEEAEAKLEELKRNGPSQSAFTFKKRFPAPAAR